MRNATPICDRIGQLILTDDPAKRADRFGSVENGSSSAAGLEQQHRMARQVSLRVRRKTIVRKAAARDTWQEAADKVRVSMADVVVGAS